MKKLNAVCLCANADDLKGDTGITSSYIFTLENGLRLGVAGIVTDYVNVWEKPKTPGTNKDYRCICGSEERTGTSENGIRHYGLHLSWRL